MKCRACDGFRTAELAASRNGGAGMVAVFVVLMMTLHIMITSSCEKSRSHMMIMCHQPGEILPLFCLVILYLGP